MVKAKQLRVKHFNAVTPDYYHLPQTVSLKETQRRHEHLAGDLYVAFMICGKEVRWSCPTDTEENVSLGLFPDRQMKVDEQIIFWEVDRGTEDYVSEKGITGKLEKYIKLSGLHPNRNFNVVFTTVDTEKQSAKARAKTFLELFERYDRGDQFLVALHRQVVTEPLDASFASPLHPFGIALLPAN